MLRKSIISFAMVGIAVLAVASSGGGDKKDVKSALPSLRSSSGFTLKAGPGNQQNRLSGTSNQYNFAMQNAVVTYRKGNTYYILPVANKNSKPCFRSNLNLLNWKVKLHK